MAQEIVITHDDLRRLNRLIETFEDVGKVSQDSAYIKTLKMELGRANIVGANEVSRDVITMNSRVQLQDLETKHLLEYTLVFPEEADPAERKVSVLAPLGTALIGYRVGDTIEFHAPAGIRRFHVTKILYQPESEGYFAG